MEEMKQLAKEKKDAKTKREKWKYWIWPRAVN